MADLKKWAKSGGGDDKAVEAHRAAAWEADRKKAAYVFTSCRLYVTDFDKDGSKASKLYDQLDRVLSTMRSYTSTIGKPAIEMVQEGESLATHKIGPASRASLEGQTKHKGKA